MHEEKWVTIFLVLITCYLGVINASSVCSSYKTCESCTGSRSCGWCELSGACLKGGQLGPFIRNSCPSVHKNWRPYLSSCTTPEAARGRRVDLSKAQVMLSLQAFPSSSLGVYVGQFHYKDCTTLSMQLTSVTVTVEDSRLVLQTGNGIGLVYSGCYAILGNSNYYGCARSDGSASCVYVDLSQGYLRVQMGASTTCPMSYTSPVCVNQDSVGSARVRRQDSVPVSLASKEYRGSLTYYSETCGSQKEQATMTVASSTLQITTRYKNISISDITQISGASWYIGIIDSAYICFNIESKGRVAIQYEIDGSCPKPMEPASCHLTTRIEIFSPPTVLEKLIAMLPKLLIAIPAVLIGLCVVVTCCCCLCCCLKRRKRTPKSTGYTPVSNNQNSFYNRNVPLLDSSKYDKRLRCVSCYVHQRHHSLLYADQCIGYSKALKFAGAESYVTALEQQFRTEKLAPTSTSYRQFEEWLKMSWVKQDDFTLNQVSFIVKFSHPTLYRAYDNYLNNKAKGKELLQWHGSSRENMLNIASTGFLKRMVGSNISNFARFGNGIYFSLCSSKSHEYSVGYSSAGNLGVVRNWESYTSGLLLCRVAVGKVMTYENDMPTIQSPPRGYQAVEGLVGANLNYPELIVYDQQAILPVCYIEFTYNQHF